jgi:hypothetical protein
MTTTHPGAMPGTSHRTWHKSPILTPDVLEPLYDINWDFLTMLTRVPRQWQAGRIGTRLPDPAYLELVSLDPCQRRDAARVPFTLYSGRFLDDRYWQQLASTPTLPVNGYDEDEPRRCLREFARVALFFAWHLARSNQAAARLVMGMPGETVAVFRGLSLTKVRQFAIDRAEILTPRWAERTVLWKKILAGPSGLGTGPSLDVGMIGIQMLAGELVAATSLREAERRRGGRKV